MNYALIGCGRISPNHLMAAISNNLNVVALCDVVPEKMEELKEKVGFDQEVHQYTSYQEMIEKEDLDLVAIATESGEHGRIALEILEKGIHLIIEKPITLSLEEADRIIKKANEKNLVVSACHQNRFNKSIQKMREAIEGRRFGKLLHGAAHIRWNRNDEYYSQGGWRGTWEQDGGALMNQCIHNIDLLRWMMGSDIDQVMAITDRINHKSIDAEDLGLAIVNFSNGSYGLIEGTTNVYPKNLEETLYIFGSRATAKAGGKSVNLIEEWDFEDQLDNKEEVINTYCENPPNIYGFGHTPLYADVIEAIQTGREAYVSAKEGRDALELVLGIYLSAAKNQPIRFPLEHVSTIDFKGRFNE